jgi:hypothetical protein
MYIIRAQGLGYLTDKVYSDLPTQADLAAVLKAELAAFGIDPKTGEPRERWVRAEEIDLEPGSPGGPKLLAGKASLEEIEALRGAAERAGVVTGAAVTSPLPVEFAGVGTVTNPSG